MMGQLGGTQDTLFYSFKLDDHVPQDHLLRGIDGVLDLGDLRKHLAPFYSNTGRPSIDPELMIRMLIVGYCFGIRSERRLCEEVHLNLAYRWFCRLDLEDAVPDHSTFSKNRQGHTLLSERRPFTKPRDYVTKEAVVIYRASQHDCTGCAMKQQCCPNTPARKIRRSVHEDSRNVARELASTPQYQQSRRDRKKVEMLFAHLNRILKLDRLRLRGLSGAHDEFLLAATAQNLRQMAKRLFDGRQSAAAVPA